ncbi:PREDICTED: F-box only protein 31-like [Acropora digitifera]|uniref:F-box only protein 31-like n=1 Tax=Acropora digitifera TaxID=70779 RepID=UPI00077A8099|nr:PREDICTED: F-box only protein 31-like [Acropora digitifera]
MAEARTCALQRRKEICATAQVFTLANELLASIFKHLNGFELCTVAKTCQRFRAASQIDQIWQHLCERDYGASSLSEWPEFSNYHDLYITVLHKYGYLLGLWKCNVNPYGGLVCVKIVQGGIDAVDCRAPVDPDIRAPLRQKRLFSIRIREGKPVVLCFSDKEDIPHYASLKVGVKLMLKSCCILFFSFGLSIVMIIDNNYFQQGMQFLRNWMKDEYNNENLLFYQPHMVQLVLMKYVNVHSMFRLPIELEALKIPRETNEKPLIMPGIFKGTYSSHGVELVMVTHSPADHKIFGTKITGDPNVPEGKLTFEVDLTRPLSEDNQEPGEGKMSFMLSNAIEARFKDFPPTYRARYHGAGQIASHGFVSPQMTPGHFVLFNDDLFGFLWNDLMAFSVYSRANEPFLQ